MSGAPVATAGASTAAVGETSSGYAVRPSGTSASGSNLRSVPTPRSVARALGIRPGQSASAVFLPALPELLFSPLAGLLGSDRFRGTFEGLATVPGAGDVRGATTLGVSTDGTPTAAPKAEDDGVRSVSMPAIPFLPRPIVEDENALYVLLAGVALMLMAALLLAPIPGSVLVALPPGARRTALVTKSALAWLAIAGGVVLLLAAAQAAA